MGDSMADRKRSRPDRTPQPGSNSNQSSLTLSQADLAEIAAIIAADRRELLDRLRDVIEEERQVVATAAAREAPDLERGAGRMLDANAVAARLGRSAQWVRENRDQLGAIPLGDGPRPRLGFPSEAVAAFVACSADSRPPVPGPALEAGKPASRRRRSGSRADLLPIRGRE